MPPPPTQHTLRQPRPLRAADCLARHTPRLRVVLPRSMDAFQSRRGVPAVPPSGCSAFTGDASTLAARSIRAPYAGALNWSTTAAALRSNYAPAAARLFVAAAAEQESEGARLSRVLGTAVKHAAGGGAAGALAMSANVAALMWVRTTVCFQYRCVRRPFCALRRPGDAWAMRFCCCCPRRRTRCRVMTLPATHGVHAARAS